MATDSAPDLRLRVGITMRSVSLQGRNETRDALDQAWIPLLERLGMRVIPIPNSLSDPLAFMLDLRIDRLILSGGNNLSSAITTLNGKPVRTVEGLGDLAPERDATEKTLLQATIARGWPVLGVCRGAQFINAMNGGALELVEGHVGLEHEIEATEESASRLGLSDRMTAVNSFHDQGIPAAGLGSGLDGLAWAPDGSIEAFAHEELPHFGIMWHPERYVITRGRDLEILRTCLEIRR